MKYRTKHAMLSIGRGVNFSPHAKGHGEFSTSDLEIREYIESHRMFKNGTIVRVEPAPAPVPAPKRSWWPW